MQKNVRSYVTTAAMPNGGSTSAGELVEKMSVRNVSFFYGQFEALKNVRMRKPAEGSCERVRRRG